MVIFLCYICDAKLASLLDKKDKINKKHVQFVGIGHTIDRKWTRMIGAKIRFIMQEDFPFRLIWQQIRSLHPMESVNMKHKDKRKKRLYS